ncbi:hypothetical protein BpHYR1_010980 [Brachionus plicatilis]|uniref:Uncharacterized protein n=1 Tax=Brachionus plicatilis TaxID=10195 RepID=A0A3M7T144_BRAPC|nr:hypothetical protein BpHYR1_010980 [Brachionus plicatilis]
MISFSKYCIRTNNFTKSKIFLNIKSRSNLLIENFKYDFDKFNKRDRKPKAKDRVPFSGFKELSSNFANILKFG